MGKKIYAVQADSVQVVKKRRRKKGPILIVECGEEVVLKQPPKDRFHRPSGHRRRSSSLRR